MDSRSSHVEVLSCTSGISKFQIRVVLLLECCQPRLPSPDYPRKCGCSEGAVFWPQGHMTIHWKFNPHYMYFCCRVACKYFSTYGTHTHTIQVVRFWEGPKLWGQCTSPESLGHWATIQFIGTLTYSYVLLPWGSLLIFWHILDSNPHCPHVRILGSSQILRPMYRLNSWPLGHTTIYGKFNLYVLKPWGSL